MEPRTIHCADCGAPYETKRSNTKYCSLCRLLKNMEFIRGRTRKCWICEVDFIPIGREDSCCADCTYQPKKYGEATCAFCDQERLRVHPEITVCHRCIRNPKVRPRVIRSLRQKIAERIEAGKQERELDAAGRC